MNESAFLSAVQLQNFSIWAGVKSPPFSIGMAWVATLASLTSVQVLELVLTNIFRERSLSRYYSPARSCFLLSYSFFAR